MKRIDNPPHSYLSTHHEWLEEPPPALPQVFEERARSILSENDSPDLGFRWSINPYRGCQHACAYCYARPTHEYLGWGAGTDFETKIVVKVNAPELLRDALSSSRWGGETIEFSGATDCYQPLEAVWKLTRQCLQVCLEFRNPACVATKSYLIRRDIDVLSALTQQAAARVCTSVAFADDKTARLIEPQAPPPSKRFEAMRALAQAGVPVGVLVSPIIPGLNDRDIAKVLARAADCGATFAAHQALRLPGHVEAVFVKRLREASPFATERIEHRIREIRGGRLNDSRFHERMTGRGPYWETIEQLFRTACRKYGFAEPPCERRANCPTACGHGEAVRGQGSRAAADATLWLRACEPHPPEDPQLKLAFMEEEIRRRAL
jgi:DNA repair photolyase